MAWGFIRLHAIGPSPWKVDGSLNIKPSPFHSPSYTTVVVYIASRSHKTSQDGVSFMIIDHLMPRQLTPNYT